MNAPKLSIKGPTLGKKENKEVRSTNKRPTSQKVNYAIRDWLGTTRQKFTKNPATWEKHCRRGWAPHTPSWKKRKERHGTSKKNSKRHLFSQKTVQRKKIKGSNQAGRHWFWRSGVHVRQRNCSNQGPATRESMDEQIGPTRWHRFAQSAGKKSKSTCGTGKQ